MFRHRSLAVLLPVLLVLASAADLGGQAVVGTVRDGSTGQPVTGAMVRLLDGGRWTGALFVTAADGRFRLTAPGPGSFDLRVERIGFAETEVGPVVVEEAETVTFDVIAVARPVRLEGLDVSAGRRRCSLPGDAEGATQTLWAEVRKALDAARWTEQEAGLQFQVAQRTRTLDPRGLRLLEEERRVTTLFGGNSVRSLPPDELGTGGYVREEDDLIYYYGPDAAVLLSDAFLDAHCFQIVEGPDEEPGLVGLAFRPVRERNPDISGVLWIHEATSRLERVEFVYTGLGRRPGAELAGGELRFAELSDGRWIVRDWFIRAPLLGLARQFVAGAFRERVAVTAVQEAGSEVITAQGPDVAWSGDPMAVLALRCPEGALVVGRVQDGEGGAGLAGAVVTAEWMEASGAASLSAVSGEGGGYWVCGPRAGAGLRLTARLGVAGSGWVEVELPRAGWAVRDLVLVR